MTSPLTPQWRRQFTQDPEVDAFVQTLRQEQTPVRVIPDDEAKFVQSLQQPAFVAPMGDQKQREKEEALSATFGLPIDVVRGMEPILSDSLTAQAPDWLSQATGSFKAGWGDVYATGARALEWAGLPASVYEPYRQFGQQLQKAYIPPMRPDEFTWRQLRNPEWYATSVARAVPFSLSLLPATIVGAYAGAGSATALGLGAFGRAALTFLGGGAFSRTIESAFEAGGAYDEALQSGATAEEADARADFVFKHNLALTGMDAAELAIAFTPLASVGRFLPDVMKRRGVAALTRIAGVGGLEAGEEVYQEAIQQLARGEDVSFGPAMKESAAIGALFGVGLGGAGSVYHALTDRVERRMPKELLDEYDANKQASKSAGMTDEDATLYALDALAESPEGQQYLDTVFKELKERSEGVEAPPVTDQDMEMEISRAEQIIEERVEPQAEILPDETFDAIVKGEASVDEVFDLEPEPQAETAASPQDAKEPSFLVTEESYQAAKATLKDKMSGLHAGVDPTVLAELVTIGAYHVERGVRTFAKWSAEMVKQFGEEIQPHLRKVWRETNQFLAGKAPTGAVKGIIRQTTGQAALNQVIREDVALAAAMRKAEQNARIAYKAGTKDALAKAKAEFQDVLLKARLKANLFGLKEGFSLAERLTRKELIAAFKDSQASAKATRRQLITYIEENLPPDLRGQYLTALIQNITKRKQERIMRRVDRAKELLTKKELIAELRELVSHDQSVALEYQRRLQELVTDLNMKRMTAATRKKLEALAEFAEREGMPSGVSQRMIETLKRLEQRPIGELTVDELKELRDMAEHLKQIGKLKQTLKYKYNDRERKAHLARLLASTHNLDPETSGKQTTKDKAKRAAMFMYLETLQAQRVAEIIDGYTDGENTKLTKSLAAHETEAQHRTHLIVESAIFELIDAGVLHFTDEQNVRLTIAIRQREGATTAVKTLMEKHGITELPELSLQEEKILMVLQKWTNKLVDETAALHEERTNTPFVKLPTYILPLYYVGEQFISAEEVIRHDYHRTTQTAQGHTIERKPGVTREPRTDVLGMFEQAINEQLWYLEMQPELDNIRRLVKTKEYVEKAGELASNWWKDHLDIVAQRGWLSSARRTPFSTILRVSRGHMTTAMLGFKLSTIMIQPFAVIDAMAYMQSKYGTMAALRVLREVTHSWVSPPFAKQAMDASYKLQRRAAGEVAVEETLREIGRSDGNWQRFIRTGMALIVKADVITAAGVQEAVRQILQEQGVPNALQEAENIMQLVSSSADVTFRPHILAWGEGARAWFTFQTFLLNRWGIISHDLIAKGLIHSKTWKAKYSALLGLAIIAAGKIAEDEARNYLYALTASRKKGETRSMTERLLFAIPSNIPIFGDLFEAFSGRSDIPVTKLLGDLFKTKDVIFAKKAETKARAALRGTEAALTVALGVPGTAQTFDIIEGIFLPDKKKGVTR